MLMAGNCITEWANVEEALFNICWQCLGCRKEHAAIVYYRSPTIDTRMQLVSELIAAILPTKKPGEHDHPDTKWWNQIVTDFRKMQSTRSRIAHHPVIIRQADIGVGANGRTIRESWFEFYISHGEAARGRSADLKLPKLGVDDLRSHLQKVNLITENLYSFLSNGLPRHTGAFSPRAFQLARAPNPNQDPPAKPRRRRKPSPP
jgi:hypothetical protein